MADQQTAPDSSRAARGGTTSRPLRMKVIGTARHGQSIEIFSKRLTIGSAPECTLRLRAPGVGPLQCLIVRGTFGPVARSLAVDTLLNGHRFREESLHPGDRLQLGTIELEFCEDEGAPASPGRQPLANPFPSSPERDRWTLPPRERPRDVLASLADETPAHSPGAPRRIVAAEGAGSAAAASAPATATAIENGPAILETERAALLETTQKIQAELARVHELRAQAQAELDRLQTERELREKDGLERESKQQASEDRLRQLQSEVERQSAEVRYALEQQRLDWDAHQTGSFQESRQFQEAIDQLAQRQAAAHRTVQQLEQAMTDERQAREKWEQELQKQSAQVEALQTQYQALATRLAAQPARDASCASVPTAPRTRSPAGESNIALSADSHSTSAPALSNPSAGPDAGSRKALSRRAARDLLVQQLASSEQVAPAELAAAEWNDRAVAEPFANVAKSPEPSRNPAPNLDANDERDAAANAAVHGLAHDQNENPLDSNAWHHQATRVAEIERSPSASTEGDAVAVAVSDDVFQRLSRAGIWKDPNGNKDGNEEGSAADVGDGKADEAADPVERVENMRTTGSPVAEGASAHQTVTEGFDEPQRGYNGVLARSPLADDDQPGSEGPAPVLTTPASSPPSEGAGEDSIEDYMQRLLQRVRGQSSISTPSLQIEEPNSDRRPRVEAVPPAVLRSEEPVPAASPQFDYQPRSQAPEIGVTLAAMRAIGNDHRNTNIRKHAQRTWSDQTRNKLYGSLAGIAVAVASVFFLDTHPEFAAVGLFAGCGVACFWIWQAVQYRRQLFDSLKLNVEPTDDEDEPSIAGVPESVG